MSGDEESKRFKIGAILGLLVFGLIWWSPDLVSEFWWTVPGLLAKLVRFVGATGVAVFGLDLLLDFQMSIKYIEKRMSGVLTQNKDYFRNLLNEVLQRNIEDKSFLTTVTRPVLESTHANIVEILSGGSFPHTGTFYRTLRKHIEPLLVAPHVENADYNFVFNWDADRHAFMSTRKISQTFHSNSACDEVDIGFKKTIEVVPRFSADEHYSLKSFRVDGKEYSDRLRGPDRSDDGKTYTWELELKVPIAANGQVKTYRRESVLADAPDMLDFRMRQGRSLKHLTVNAEFDAPVEPRLIVYGFSGSDSECEPNNEATHCDVDWQGWMIPDHSFVLRWESPICEIHPSSDSETNNSLEPADTVPENPGSDCPE